jgi:protein-tyrosine-phosphatase
LNSEYIRLGQSSTITEELQRQYSQLLKFYDNVTSLTLFSPDQKEKLCCYHVSTLIGAANVCGIRRDNTTQITYLEQALSITRTIGNDVQDPYSTGQNFYVKTINDLCKNKIQRTRAFLHYDQQRRKSGQRP